MLFIKKDIQKKKNKAIKSGAAYFKWLELSFCTKNNSY